jgi:hypothetical protein
MDTKRPSHKAEIIDLMPYLDRMCKSEHGEIDVQDSEDIGVYDSSRWESGVKQSLHEWEIRHRNVWEIDWESKKVKPWHWYPDSKAIDAERPLMSPNVEKLNFITYYEQLENGTFELREMTPSVILDILEYRAEKNEIPLTDPYNDILDFQIATGIAPYGMTSTFCNIMKHVWILQTEGDLPKRILDYYPVSHPLHEKFWRKKKEELISSLQEKRRCLFSENIRYNNESGRSEIENRSSTIVSPEDKSLNYSDDQESSEEEPQLASDDGWDTSWADSYSSIPDNSYGAEPDNPLSVIINRSDDPMPTSMYFLLVYLAIFILKSLANSTLV